MKVQEFYNALGRLTSRGYKVTKTTARNEKGAIRLALTDKSLHKTFTPVTAVAHALSGKYFQGHRLDKANEVLRLHSDTLVTLACAAEDSEAHPTVNKRLRKALGL